MRRPAREHPKAHMAPVGDEPVAGFYRGRMVRGGVWVTIRIWYGPPHDPITGEELDRSPRWQAERNGELVAVYAVWPYCAGEPISEAEYRFMLADAKWAREHAPGDPKAKPTERPDFSDLAPPF